VVEMKKKQKEEILEAIQSENFENLILVTREKIYNIRGKLKKKYVN
jgi:hypothetical protein